MTFDKNKCLNIINNTNSIKEIGKITEIIGLIIEDAALSTDGTIVETPLSRVDSRVSSQIDEIAARLINGVTDDLRQE